MTIRQHDFDIASMILDGLIAAEVIQDYDLTLTHEGYGVVTAYGVEGVPHPRRISTLGPLEAAIETARSLLRDPLDWA